MNEVAGDALTSAQAMLTQDFGTLPELIRAHAKERGERIAVADGADSLSYAQLDAAMDRVAATMQRHGVARGEAIAIIATNSVPLATVYLSALRAGAVPTPIAPSATPDAIAAMVKDAGARLVFSDDTSAAIVAGISLASLDGWMVPAGTMPEPVTIVPGDAFNIIYSSGTTGKPKGIVQSHAMRWQHLSRNSAAGFDEAVTLIATPLYSNTTLVSFLPTIAWGGTAVLMGKFDARTYLELAQRYRATHTMLVPVQYQRIMALPDFDAYDLSSFRFKTCTSAPFPAELKADVVARWPGLLVEYYGMTEGGASFMLVANHHPDKLDTVGHVMPGHEARLIDTDGREVATGKIGEVVGRSPAMMTGYHGRGDATREAEWFNGEGQRFIRHGDLGRLDADGFLTLVGRSKDLIISGGFNIYPTDLEAVLAAHPGVADCAVIGVSSETWGETPVGFYVPAGAPDEGAILTWTNARLGKTQRLSALRSVAELPRSSIGKVLKRELRDRWTA